MAIYGAVPPPEDLDASAAVAAAPVIEPIPPPPTQTPPAPLDPSQTSTTAIDIEAWTISALESLSVSPIARGTGTPLAINIDEQVKKTSVTIATDAAAVQQPPIRRPLSRRDSQKKREQLLKGNEGSRQRRRWENGRSTPFLAYPPHMTSPHSPP